MFLHILDSKTARSIGLKYYFTGKPCCRGEFNQRSISDNRCQCYLCKQARADIARRYIQNNKEDLSERRKAAYQENRESILQQVKAYAEQNKGKISEAKKSHYKKNKDKILAKNKRYREANKNKIASKNKERYLKNRDNILAQKKIYRQENQEIIARKGKIYHQKNREHRLLTNKQWRETNKDLVVAKSREYYAENKDYIKDRVRKYRKSNIHKVRTLNEKRRTMKLNATPSYFSELDGFVYQEAAALCKMREQLTGFKWHVDHMVPLLAKSVCGLHVWNNFQLLPARINNIKKNRLMYVNPHEWLTDIPKFFNVIAA